MKVKELIDELSCMDEDAEVCFAYQYGDYWRTIVSPEVKYVSDGLVAFSDYHSMNKLIFEEDLGAENAEPVVVLSNMKLT